MRLLFLALLIFPLVSSDWTGPQFMEKLNKARREVAKREKIPNMRELVWSDDLAHEALITKVYDPDERYMEEIYDSTYEELLNSILEETSKIQRNADPERDNSTTQYHYPLFEKIGCDKEQDNMENRTTIWCMFSPGIAEEHSDDFFNFKSESIFLESGEAGSKCDYGYEDNDGLCKYTGATTVITTTATTTEVTTTTKKPTPNTPTASISVPNHEVVESSGNDVPTEPSSSYPIFSMVHVLVVLVFGYSIFI